MTINCPCCGAKVYIADYDEHPAPEVLQYPPPERAMPSWSLGVLGVFAIVTGVVCWGSVVYVVFDFLL